MKPGVSGCSDDDAIYIIAIRSRAPKNGDEVKAALDALRDHVEPVTAPVVAYKRAGEATARDHEALRQLGLAFEHANSVFPVVGFEPDPRPSALPSGRRSGGGA